MLVNTESTITHDNVIQYVINDKWYSITYYYIKPINYMYYDNILSINKLLTI